MATNKKKGFVVRPGLVIRPDSRPIEGAPMLVAMQTRLALTSNPFSGGSAPDPESYSSFMWQNLGKLFFDTTMGNFWSKLRREKPQDEVLKKLIQTGTSRASKAIAAQSLNRLENENTRAEEALKITAYSILEFSRPEHPYLYRSREDVKRDVEKLTRRTKSLIQALKLAPFFDLKAFPLLNSGFLEDEISVSLMLKKNEFFRVFNQRYCDELKSQMPAGLNLRNDQEKLYSDKVALAATEMVDPKAQNKLSDDIAAEILESAKNRAIHNASLLKDNEPNPIDKVSDLLAVVADFFDKYLEHELVDSSKPRPQGENASIISFCRCLDEHLRCGYGVSSPKLVANCASTIYGKEIGRDAVKRWRGPIKKG